MADPVLASLLLFGGFAWAALVVLAMANSPTSGSAPACGIALNPD
jgi:hypothetical protein